MKLDKIKWLLVLATSWLAVAVTSQTPTIQVSKPNYQPNEPISVTFANGPGTPKDWIGLYKADVTPGPGPTLWNYVDGTHDGVISKTSGTVNFPSGLAEEGEWVAYFLENDGYTVLASAPFTIRLTQPAVIPSSETYARGTRITINFRNGPGNARDWIGIFKKGETPSSTTPPIFWNYVDGTRTGSTGIKDGSVAFEDGLQTAGEYVVHFLSNDTYTSIASANFNVLAELPFVSTHHSKYFPDEQIIVYFGNGPGNPRDWIGLYYVDHIPDADPGAFQWAYVSGTQTPGAGVENGSVALLGLALAGDYKAFFLENDGYEIINSDPFSVVDPSTTLVRLNKRIFKPGEDIIAEFVNGPGNAKDWLAVYDAGVIPDGNPDATLWSYVDGTRNGTQGLSAGTVTFTGGLTKAGKYSIHLLENDGYTILSTEDFTVREAEGSGVRVASISPANGGQNLPPIFSFKAQLENVTAALNPQSVALTLDGNQVLPVVTLQERGALIEYSPGVLPEPGFTHTYLLKFSDTSSPPVETIRESTFTFGNYKNIVLPNPIYFNHFDSVPEGQLPQGWTEVNYTEVDNPAVDFGDLNSAAYKTWTAVDANRFNGPLLTYSVDPTLDYQRVLSPNPFNVLNGQVYNQPLASGRLLFANSGYRNGGAQIMYLYSPDFDLTGKTDVHLSFHSLWEQYFDNFASLEYSIDQGQTWLPILYMLDFADIVRVGENIDAVETFNRQRDDVATYSDPVSGETKGGNYGAFIGAQVSPALWPYISGRTVSDPVNSKRIELFRLPQADNQSKVRFRFAHAGGNSWYWGIDDFGLYSIPASGTRPTLSLSRSGGQIVISWDSTAAGFTLQATTSLANPNWQTVQGVQNNSVTHTPQGVHGFYRLVRTQ